MTIADHLIPENSASKIQLLAQRLVLQLHMVLRTLRIHDPRNKALLVATENLKDTINTLWAADKGSLRLLFVEGVVYVNDVRVRMDVSLKEQVDNLQHELEKRELGGLAFSRPVDTEALRRFLIAFSKPVDEEIDLNAYKASLLELRDLALELLEPFHFTNEPEDGGQLRIDKKTFALQAYAKGIVSIREFIRSLQAGASPDPRLRVTRIVQDLVDIATERVNFLLRFSTIKQANDYPYNHAVNTCILSIVIGRALQVGRLDLVDLGVSAMLADVGFALLPPADIDRSVEFGEAERSRLRDAMVRQLRFLMSGGKMNDAAVRRIIVAYEHHLPYKDPESGQRGYTHLFSRIVQVADTFDALTTRRPWREGYTADEALRMMLQEAGTRYDPLIVKVLVNLLGLYPLGSAVRLGSGEIGVVYHNSTDPKLFTQPWVRIVIDEAGQKVEKMMIRNLAESDGPGAEIAEIVKSSELEGIDAGMAIVL